VKVLETERLVLRWFSADDAEFMLALLTDPAWLKYIGDRGVRDVDGARDYIEKGPRVMYERYGFGLWATALKDDGTVIGMCGLVKRDGLDDVDIGFAFLPAYRSQGYAYEAAAATMAYARDTVGLTRVVAITSQDNHRSGRLLEKIGLRFERLIQMPNDGELLRLYATNVARDTTTEDTEGTTPHPPW
jgi:RimJ/RimL family protein N-acetyltransferase